jgi:RNA 2',3'-cyclic 3'-phosphodiesterase
METIRAFIAIELSDEVKDALKILQGKLRSAVRTPVKWTDPEGTHLTLVFLGNVETSTVNKVSAVIESASRGIKPFRLRVSGLGVFPNPSRVRVAWVGVTGDLEVLGRLQKNIETTLEPLGFKPEARAFTPHLTLGRVRDDARPDERQALGKLIGDSKDTIDVTFDVNSVHLFRSQLRPTGAVYSKIATIELK